MKIRALPFTLTDLPADVLCVEAVFETHRDREGYVLCKLDRTAGEDEWVVWRYFRPLTTFGLDRRRLETMYRWGYYTTDREEALRNLFARTGFGRVEALTEDGVML